MSKSISKNLGYRSNPFAPAGTRTPVGSQLSRAEECELAGLIASGDRDARDRLFLANRGLVGAVAQGFRGRGLEVDDLISEGNLGLLRATTEFRPQFGVRFSTYACYWIRQSIRHALINTTATIRLPAHMTVLMTKWRRAEQALIRAGEALPSFDEVAKVLQLSDTQRELVTKARQALNYKVGNSETSRQLNSDYGAPSSRQPACEAKLIDADERCVLSEKMKCLDERERTILRLRYGLEGAAPQTLRQIGVGLGVTREWVRKIEIRALRKLNEELAAQRDSQTVRPQPLPGRPGGRSRRETSQQPST